MYHAAPFAERAAAHLTIAEALRGQPDRYAWHLAAAALKPDERVAALLEETAAEAQRRGGGAAAARTLERAAELTPGQSGWGRGDCWPPLHSRRPTGQPDWVRELAARVAGADRRPRTCASPPGYAIRLVLRDLVSTGTPTRSPVLISVAEQASSRLPVIAWHAVGAGSHGRLPDRSPRPGRREVLAGNVDGTARAAAATWTGRLGRL